MTQLKRAIVWEAGYQRHIKWKFFANATREDYLNMLHRSDLHMLKHVKDVLRIEARKHGTSK